MSQTFILKLAVDTLSEDAKKLGVKLEQLQQIYIVVHASVKKSIMHSASTDSSHTTSRHTEDYLWLTYKITMPSLSLAEKLQWSSWQSVNVAFSDYLWQQTCLECFIAHNESSYVEINANPDGRYALYHFDDYRSPSTLPPNPLIRADSKNTASKAKASIYWDKSADTKANQDNSTHFERSFAIGLAQLPFDLSDTATQTLIHPCVILYLNDTALYFAPRHASAADFHQRYLWSDFKH